MTTNPYNLFALCVYTGIETSDDLSYLVDQDIVEPLWDFRDFQDMQIGGGGLGVAIGWVTAEWSWAFLDKTARDFLWSFCAGTSEKVLIRTKISTNVFGVFTCVMYWPPRDVWNSNSSMGLSIKFANLVELP